MNQESQLLGSAETGMVCHVKRVNEAHHHQGGNGLVERIESLDKLLGNIALFEQL